MKFTIKNLKHSEFASHETHCFKATLYVNGKPFCKVSNDGQGGSNNYRPLNESTKFNELSKEIRNINSELSKEKIQFDDFEIENDLDIVVGDLVNEGLLEKQIKKLLKRVCYVDADCNKGTIKQLATKHKPSRKVFEAVKNAPWWTDQHILLNELPDHKIKQYI